MYTLGEAARASGKSKPTIAKAIKTGRVSAIRQPDGSYQIDPAELHRVYPVNSKSGGRWHSNAKRRFVISAPGWTPRRKSAGG